MSKLTKVLLVALSLLLMFSCKKEEVNQAEVDDTAILNYLSQHKLEATKHPSGLYYSIISSGEGTNPSYYSTVEVGYKGWLTNDVVFDQTKDGESITFELYNLIPGWQIGIPMIKTGGTIRLYVPSSLGYGSRKVGSIPANSVLIFDVDLVSHN